MRNTVHEHCGACTLEDAHTPTGPLSSRKRGEGKPADAKIVNGTRAEVVHGVFIPIKRHRWVASRCMCMLRELQQCRPHPKFCTVVSAYLCMNCQCTDGSAHGHSGPTGTQCVAWLTVKHRPRPWELFGHAFVQLHPNGVMLLRVASCALRRCERVQNGDKEHSRS